MDRNFNKSREVYHKRLPGKRNSPLICQAFLCHFAYYSVNILQSAKLEYWMIIGSLTGKNMSTTKIIVIDDDVAVTDLLSVLLRTHGFDVRVTNNSTEGMGLIRDEKFDLVILDLMMPEMDGWEICKEVRSFSQVPIIVLSALNDPSMVASVLDAGADDYLTKPTPSRILVAHINRLTRRNGTAPSSAAKNVVTGPANPLAAS
jgi:CheY-like chemotaxis protein